MTFLASYALLRIKSFLTEYTKTLTDICFQSCSSEGMSNGTEYDNLGNTSLKSLNTEFIAAATALKFQYSCLLPQYLLKLFK